MGRGTLVVIQGDGNDLFALREGVVKTKTYDPRLDGRGHPFLSPLCGAVEVFQGSPDRGCLRLQLSSRLPAPSVGWCGQVLYPFTV